MSSPGLPFIIIKTTLKWYLLPVVDFCVEKWLKVCMRLFRSTPHRPFKSTPRQPFYILILEKEGLRARLVQMQKKLSLDTI